MSSNASASAVETPVQEPESRDRIARRAYELYLARGAADGAELDDWLTAEREVTESSRTDVHGDDGE